MRVALLAALVAATPLVLSAQKGADDSTAQAIAEFEAGLRYQTGTVQVGDGLATLNLPSSLRFLGPKDARHLLTEGWGNPPEAAAAILGMIVPSGISPLADAGWGIIVEFEEDGYVDDEDAGTIDYGDLLAQMQEDTEESNKARAEAGYGTVQLLGWAEPPHYDSVTHKLYWAKELAFEGNEEHTLNYNIRILGRRGVLVLNAVGSMGQLDLIRNETPAVLTAVEFNDGHRYTDFIDGDAVATYGLGGLIAGAAAAKTGLLKGIWLALLAGKKFVLFAVVGVGAWLKTKFGQKDEAAA